MVEELPVASGPIVAPGGASAAEACRPENPLDDSRYHIYDSNPAPWWLALLWAAYLIFGASYLIYALLA